jgi:hypothetical protein
MNEWNLTIRGSKACGELFSFPLRFVPTFWEDRPDKLHIREPFQTILDRLSSKSPESKRRSYQCKV